MAKSPFLTWLDNLLNPINARMQRDVESIRRELETHKEELIPLEKEERELLSSQFVPQSGKKRRRRRRDADLEGFFSTIYHEPAIVWKYKSYGDKARHALLVACTLGHEYVFTITGDQAELIVGPYRVGTLTAQGRLISSKKREELARYGERNNSYQSVLVYGKDVGALALPAESQAPMPRAFGFLTDMDEKMWDLFLALAIFEMVKWVK